MRMTMLMIAVLIATAGVALASHAPGSRAWCAIVTGDETATCKK